MPSDLPATTQRTPEQEFALRVSTTANKQLQAILGTDAGKKAAHTITMAMLSAMRTAKNPRAFLDVTMPSIASSVATSYDTGLYPGGPNPTVYLVPQAPRKGEQPELQWRITHRGLAILAQRAGFAVMAVPVHREDALTVSFGEAVDHQASPDAWPASLDDIVGVIVVVRRVSDGVTIARSWMPIAAIIQRKNKGRDGSVWNEWPVEMAQKTAIKWAFSRGYVPLDSPEVRAAMEADVRGDVGDAAVEVAQPTPRRAPSLTERLQIPETKPEDTDPVADREAVQVNADDEEGA